MMPQYQATVFQTAADKVRLLFSFVFLIVALGLGNACTRQADGEVSPNPSGVAAAQVSAVAERPDDDADESAITEPVGPAPDVDESLAFQVASGVTVIPDSRIAFVPNIGIIEGSESVLIVDTGLGAVNGERALMLARKIAGGRKLYLTTTHFHPEHNFGASAFEGSATLVLNEAQAIELREKGPDYIELFKTFGSQVEERLEGTTLVEPDRTYSGTMTLDLGGREVILREIPAHTRGDQLVYVPDLHLIFSGDIAETRFFPIMPDADSSAVRWIGVLQQLEALEPKIVVPGHGAVGSKEILSALRTHIEFMRDRVQALVATGYDQQAITDLLVPAITAVYPNWDNQEFVPFEIAILYAEATGNAPQLPGF